MSTGSILIIGATSGMARAVATEFAVAGKSLVLLARDENELAALGSDLALRHNIPVRTITFDAIDYRTHAATFASVLGPETEGAIVFVGYLGDALLAREDADEARKILETNFSACVAIIEPIAAYFEQRGNGWICGIGSVAGDRGRQSNYHYGAAKAGLATYLAGLHHRLAPRGVTVLCIKPGFIDTRMTYGKPGLFLVCPPQVAAKQIVQAIMRRARVVYVPGFWRYIMIIIRLIPAPIFERTRL